MDLRAISFLIANALLLDLRAISLLIANPLLLDLRAISLLIANALLLDLKAISLLIANALLLDLRAISFLIANVNIKSIYIDKCKIDRAKVKVKANAYQNYDEKVENLVCIGVDWRTDKVILIYKEIMKENGEKV